jgi:hypothetical protein
MIGINIADGNNVTKIVVTVRVAGSHASYADTADLRAIIS